MFITKRDVLAYFIHLNSTENLLAKCYNLQIFPPATELLLCIRTLKFVHSARDIRAEKKWLTTRAPRFHAAGDFRARFGKLFFFARLQPREDELAKQKERLPVVYKN